MLDMQIIGSLASGKYSKRLADPSMDDRIWDLIQRCWLRNPSERPTMEQILAWNLASPIIAEVCAISRVSVKCC